MTAEEQKALNRLGKAIQSAHKLGIRLAGMDGSLIYANREAFYVGKALQATMEAEAGGGSYGAVACAVKEATPGSGVLDTKCYEDSGAW